MFAISVIIRHVVIRLIYLQEHQKKTRKTLKKKEEEK